MARSGHRVCGPPLSELLAAHHATLSQRLARCGLARRGLSMALPPHSEDVLKRVPLTLSANTLT